MKREETNQNCKRNTIIEVIKKFAVSKVTTIQAQRIKFLIKKVKACTKLDQDQKQIRNELNIYKILYIPFKKS